MAQFQEPRKSIRVIPASSKDPGVHRVVNIRTVKANEHSERLQLPAASYMSGIHATVKDSGGQFPGLPTIVVTGYSAPD